MSEAGMLGRRKNQVAEAHLFNVPQSLHPGMIDKLQNGSFGHRYETVDWVVKNFVLCTFVHDGIRFSFFMVALLKLA
jgi:hypothetical protein